MALIVVVGVVGVVVDRSQNPSTHQTPPSLSMHRCLPPSPRGLWMSLLVNRSSFNHLPNPHQQAFLG